MGHECNLFHDVIKVSQSVAIAEIPQHKKKSKNKKAEKKIQMNYRCERCGRNYLTKGSLKRHERFKCRVGPQRYRIEIERKHKCDRCGRSYVHKRSLYTHARFECGVEPKFVCDYCDFKTKRKNDLRCHIGRRHLKTGKFNIV